MKFTNTLEPILLFAICFSLAFGSFASTILVIPMIIAVSTAALILYLDRPVFRWTLAMIYVIVGLNMPILLLFIPLMIFGIYRPQNRMWIWIPMIPVLTHSMLDWPYRLLLLSLCIFAAVTRHRHLRHHATRQQYLTLSDQANALTMKLQQQNRALLEKQDQEVHLATSNERNRIAREIHDHVGHQISSAMLQLGAIEVVHPDISEITTVRQTLTGAMDNIRSSVHDLYHTSLNFDEQVHSFANNFTRCPLDIRLTYESDLIPEIKLTLIAIIKEGLSNIMKHSNADQAVINFVEHPGFYQLTVFDNGTAATVDESNGIGLKSIAQRVQMLNGHFRIVQENGFTLFITIPKETL